MFLWCRLVNVNGLWLLIDQGISHTLTKINFFAYLRTVWPNKCIWTNGNTQLDRKYLKKITLFFVKWFSWESNLSLNLVYSFRENWMIHKTWWRERRKNLKRLWIIYRLVPLHCLVEHRNTFRPPFFSNKMKIRGRS